MQKTEVITLNQVKNHPSVVTFIARADEVLGVMGYTEHGYRHADLVASIAYNILSRLDFPPREAELAEISGYLHDMGNVAGRQDHGAAGAILSSIVLRELGMPEVEIGIIMSAIGTHEEENGSAVNPVSAALIIADKSDVHRTRVRNTDFSTFDIHDRVNYAAQRSFLRVDLAKKTLSLEIDIDTEISQVMEYFEIFLSRMVMCRRAAELLGCQFKLIINGVSLL
ncbi:uncharacterized protein HKBW3S43_00504 [Candidatus Hakubella thermalkaliphila]|uniref:HD/PDEase domain-containing protein n=1 Tax=Candidatus Hakubella thermalkaliphila TaxID=2754717 RepID=A0A6V8PPX2_9ACTN|nr:HD domain-containing protein [Candidatus Hakubella thermalkaliphila]GFP34712.1 uncharacterized protein HKBW3S43_00504 [Candidatus Hakubella thermalkaliphila]